MRTYSGELNRGRCASFLCLPTGNIPGHPAGYNPQCDKAQEAIDECFLCFNFDDFICTATDFSGIGGFLLADTVNKEYLRVFCLRWGFSGTVNVKCLS